jgi:urease accessory protein
MPPANASAHRCQQGRFAAALASGFGLSLLSTLPAAAHGGAESGLMAGASHPLLGLDHLLLLLGVAGLAAQTGNRVLLYAIGGALAGGALGAMGGTLPGAEILAALAVSALGLLLRRHGDDRAALPGAEIVGGIVAAAVAVHALLHGQESSGQAAWWLGALLASTTVVGLTTLILRQADRRWRLLLAGGLSLAGVVLAMAPLA